MAVVLAAMLDPGSTLLPRCRGTASNRHGSWFKLSNLTLWEIMNITYDILRRDPAHRSSDPAHQVEETGMVPGINHHSVAGVTHASPSTPIVLLLSTPRSPPHTAPVTVTNYFGTAQLSSAAAVFP